MSSAPSRQNAPVPSIDCTARENLTQRERRRQPDPTRRAVTSHFYRVLVPYTRLSAFSFAISCLPLANLTGFDFLFPRGVHQFSQDPGRLLDADYSGKTVLMHATGAQRSAVFARFFKTIQDTLSYDQVSERWAAPSSDRPEKSLHNTTAVLLQVVCICRTSSFYC